MAGVTSVFDKVANNLGAIEKAIIEIVDARPEGHGGAQPQQAAPQAPHAQGGGKTKIKAPKTTYTRDIDKKSLFDDMKSQVTEFKDKNVGEIFGQAGVKQYVVQFNPSSLTLRGFGSGFTPIMTYGTNGAMTQSTSQSVSINFNVRLILDQVDPFDSFMADKLNVSPTQLAQNAVKTGLTIAGVKKITVQDTAEAFVGALRSPYTRIITFHWGDMNYSGLLNGVTVNYVMFNQQGEPVRAYLDLSLRNNVSDLLPNSLGPWLDAYKAAFMSTDKQGVEQFKDLDTVRNTQKFGNLINLGG
ncbi:MAG: hypothetical protein K6E50_11965 [Lachnospiraceae bacterium]|nr:hypothetical protein [Lachnospiraceae bacterium]